MHICDEGASSPKTFFVNQCFNINPTSMTHPTNPVHRLKSPHKPRQRTNKNTPSFYTSIVLQRLTLWQITAPEYVMYLYMSS